MKYRLLKDLKISEISLGCWALGGLNWAMGHSTGWADVNVNDIKEAVNFAIDNGVNHFDNADCYGNGAAERMLSNVLGKKNNKVMISSKVGHFYGTALHPYEPLHIKHQCEQSLINLKRDYIDIYYFHHGNFGENYKYLDDALDMMCKLKKEGKIRYIGLSAYSTRNFRVLIPKIKPDVIQTWAHVMDDKFIKEKSVVRLLVEKYNIPVVAFSPLNQGLLLGKYSYKNPPKFVSGDHRKNQQKFSYESLKKLYPKMEKLKSRFGSDVSNLARVALQYILNEKVVLCVIPGFRNKEQVKANLKYKDIPLSSEDIQFIKETFK